MFKLIVPFFVLSATSIGWSQELKKIDSLERSLVEAPEPKQKMDIFNMLAAEMMDVNIHLAKRYADSAIQLGQRTDYPSGLGLSYLNAGMERWLNGYYEEAEKYYKQAIDIYLKLNDSSKLATTYSYLGISYHYHAANELALKYHFMAKSINESLGDMQRVAHNLDNIALAYQHMGQFDKVIEYSSRALEIRTNLTGYTSRTNVYNYGGIVFNRNAFEETIKYQKKALKEELYLGNDQYKIGQSLNNIGSTFYSVGQYDSAVFYLRKSSEAVKKLNIPNRYAGQLNELGEALRELGNLSESETIFQQCLIIWDSVGHRTSRAIIRYNIAQVFMKQGFFKKALYHLDSAYAIAVSMHYNPFLAKLLYLKSKIFIELKDYERAKENALSGLDMALKINVRSSIMNGYEILARISKLQENYREALEYLSKHVQLKDSLYNGESSLQLAQTQVVFETNQKNKEIEFLNTQNASQKLKIKQRNIILILTVAGIISLAYGFYKRQIYIKRLDIQTKKIEYQNLQLAKRNHEKGLLLGEIHHRVKNNLQVISSILNLQSRKLTDPGSKDAVQEGRSRVKAMALIHQQLYKNDHYSSIHIPEYLHTLVNTIGESFGYDQGSFDFETRIDDIHLDIDPAIKLGLITNELITNVFKHAFKQRKLNVLRIDFSKGQNEWVLTIADNGPGVMLEQLGSSGNFGIFLVKNLVNDLNGEIQFEIKNGTIVHIVLNPFA